MDEKTQDKQVEFSFYVNSGSSIASYVFLIIYPQEVYIPFQIKASPVLVEAQQTLHVIITQLKVKNLRKDK